MSEVQDTPLRVAVQDASEQTRIVIDSVACLTGLPRDQIAQGVAGHLVDELFAARDPQEGAA